MVKKFVRVKGDVEISHDDQEIDGLTFRVQFEHGADHIMLIAGEAADIAKYVAAHGCIVLDRAMIKTLYDETFPNKTITCNSCGGTGTRTIKEYAVDKEESDLKDRTK